MNERYSDEQVQDAFNALMNSQEVGAFGELPGVIQEFEISTRRLYNLAHELCIADDIYGRNHSNQVAFRHLRASADSFGSVVEAILLSEQDHDSRVALISEVFLEDELRRREIFEALGREYEMELSMEESFKDFVSYVLSSTDIDNKIDVLIVAQGGKMEQDMRKLLPGMPKRSDSQNDTL